jgi:hypothetical protein
MACAVLAAALSESYYLLLRAVAAAVTANSYRHYAYVTPLINSNCGPYLFLTLQACSSSIASTAPADNWQ